MKKRLLAVLLVLVMVFAMSTTASAYTNTQLRAADAMYHLGLFQGRTAGTKDYDLDGGLTRAEAAVALLRMIGEDDEAAKTDKSENQFQDVTRWYTPYVVYAQKIGLVNGTQTATATKPALFSPETGMTDYMFLTLTLRVLGYKDGNKAGDPNSDFYWKEPYQKAKEGGLISSTAADSTFTRGDMVSIFWNAMEARFKGTQKTLADDLIAQGVFTAAELSQAKNIYTYGTVTPVVPGGGTGDSGTTEPGAEEEATVTYEEYLAMTAEEQMAFFNSFADPLKYVECLDKAKAEYDANQEKIEIDGDSSIDIGDIVNGQN